jgi:hypothetical protein
VRTYRADYGIDYTIYTYATGGEVEPAEIKVQIKSTDRLPLLADGRTISVSISTADVYAWWLEYVPVILIQYDAPKNRAYWIDVVTWATHHKPAVADWRTKTVQVHIPRTNRFTPRSMQRIRVRKNEILGYDSK